MKSPLAVLAIASLLGAASLHAQAEAPAASDELTKIEALAAAEFAKDNAGSLTVAVIRPEHELWTKTYGSAALETQTPVTAETRYRIGSITKQFTALMFLQLLEAGKVNLADPVEKYVPELRQIRGAFAGAPPITLVQLATHTSGLAAEPEDAARFTAGPVKDWEKTLLSALPSVKFAYPPGSRYAYSNVGYAILGLALSRVAKQPYTSYVAEHIFRPLGMTHTTFEVTDPVKDQVAVGYEISAAGISSTVSTKEHQGRGYKVPNGAVYTTAADLSKFVMFELGAGPAEVLKPESLDQNYQRLIVANGNLSGGYGTGFEVFRRGTLVGFGHSGLVAGYESAAYFSRATRTGVIMLRSATGGSFRGARLCVAILQELDAKYAPAR